MARLERGVCMRLADTFRIGLAGLLMGPAADPRVIASVMETPAHYGPGSTTRVSPLTETDTVC